DRLGDAVVRLYERYADLLPDGPARARAAATARSVAALPGPMSLDRLSAIFGPDVEFVDHRPVGLPSSRGREAYLRLLQSFLDLADDPANRVDDVLGLRPDACLLRVTNFGTDRTSGGAFERPGHLLSLFDADGLVTHWEFFDPDHAAEALARFDELTAESATPRVAAGPFRPASKRERRVRANAATISIARVAGAVVACAADAPPPLFADELEVGDHTTGAVFDRDGELSSLRSLLRARDPTLASEPLATLGDSLALFRTSTSGSKFAGGAFDVGAYEMLHIDVIE